MIQCHSLIFKIKTIVYTFTDLFKTQSYVQYSFCVTVTCDVIMRNLLYRQTEERDYIIYIMLRMFLPCWIFKSTDAH